MAQRIMSPHKLRELLDEMTLVDTTTKRQDQLARRIERRSRCCTTSGRARGSRPTACGPASRPRARSDGREPDRPLRGVQPDERRFEPICDEVAYMLPELERVLAKCRKFLEESPPPELMRGGRGGDRDVAGPGDEVRGVQRRGAGRAQGRGEGVMPKLDEYVVAERSDGGVLAECLVRRGRLVVVASGHAHRNHRNEEATRACGG